MADVVKPRPGEPRTREARQETPVPGTPPLSSLRSMRFWG
jgi:hypothetical protein